MSHIWRYIKRGWHIMAEVHLATWIISFLPTVVPASLLAWWAAATGLPLPIVTTIGLIAFAALYLVLLGEMGKRAERRTLATVSPLPETKQAPEVIARVLEPDRIFIHVEPEYLMQFFKDHTEIQAQRLLEAYIGKWMKISAPVFNVGRSLMDDGITVTLHRGSDNTAIFSMQFAARWKDLVIGLRRNDQFTAIGKVKHASRNTVSFADCEPA